MDNDPKNPDPKGNKAAITLMWLMVGLAPILIVLSVGSSNAASNGSAFLVILASCIICNLLGGFGCARNMQDLVARVFLGLFLAVCFFVVTVIVAVFQACSHFGPGAP